MTFTVILSYRIYPMKILKFKTFLFIPFLCILPFLLSDSPTSSMIFFIQVFGITFGFSGIPADAILFAHFPVFKRFTYVSFIYAISRSLMAVVTSFGIAYLTSFLGPWGLYFIFVPLISSFLWGIYHYEKLEHRTDRSFLGSLFQWKTLDPFSNRTQVK